VLATSIYGTDFDRLLDLALVMPLLGLDHVGPSGREVPSGIFHDLATWHLIHHAYARARLHHAAELWTAYANLALHRRLMHVLQQRLGHQLLANVEAAKIACANAAHSADIDLACIEPTLHATLAPETLNQTDHRTVFALAPLVQALERTRPPWCTTASAASPPRQAGRSRRRGNSTCAGAACHNASTSRNLESSQP
jgi:hypothetical chaperone protein